MGGVFSRWSRCGTAHRMSSLGPSCTPRPLTCGQPAAFLQVTRWGSAEALFLPFELTGFGGSPLGQGAGPLGMGCRGSEGLVLHVSGPLTLSSLPELANAGRPLFPGNDVDDQLKRIFRYPSIPPCLEPSARGVRSLGAQRAGIAGGGGLGQRGRGCGLLRVRRQGQRVVDTPGAAACSQLARAWHVDKEGSLGKEAKRMLPQLRGDSGTSRRICGSQGRLTDPRGHSCQGSGHSGGCVYL